MAGKQTLALAILVTVGCAAPIGVSASAAVMTNRTPVDFSGGSVSVGFGPNFGTRDITFSDNANGGFSFNPVSVSTIGGGAFGFFSFFNQPSTFFDPIRGSGSLTFDGTTQFASSSTPVVIPYSITPFIIALADTTADGIHYGYGRFSGTTLLSYGFESVAGQAITISNTSLAAVPLPGSAPLLGAALVTMAAVGYGAKRRKIGAQSHGSRS